MDAKNGILTGGNDDGRVSVHMSDWDEENGMRADRLIEIVMRLQHQGKMTTAALAEVLGVSRRTILRDVEALSTAGIPIYTEGGHGGGVALDADYRTSLTGLARDEAVTLFIASSGKVLDDVGLEGAAKRSLLKLFAALPAQHQPRVEHLRQRLLIDPDWWWREKQESAVWDALQQAVYEDWMIDAVYENFRGEVAERRLEPYSLIAKSSYWYLVARRDGEFRTYRAARFREIRVLDAHFERVADFDLPSYWAAHVEAFGEAIAGYESTLRVHVSKIDFVKWAAPGRSVILEPEDGDGWVTIRLKLDSVELAKMMVFGLGRLVEVVDPPELGEMVREAARELVERG